MLIRVAIRNYRSLADVEVTFEPLTVLIGANASGKSNLIDALALITDSLSGELETAVLSRGGREALVWYGAQEAAFSLALDYKPDPRRAATTYEMEVGFGDGDRPVVLSERILLKQARTETRGRRRNALDVALGRGKVFDEAIEAHREITGDAHTLLVAALGLFEEQPQVKQMRDFVEGWTFMRVDVDAIRQPQTYLRTESLSTSASNLALVLHAMMVHRPEALASVNEMLSAVIPGEPRAEPQVVGGKVILGFRSAQFPDQTFPSSSVSDGTLRLLAYLTALEIDPHPSLICIEEPEHGLHPDAVAGLIEILSVQSAERRIQLLLTTHAPEVLDAVPSPASIRVVEKQADGSTRVGPIDEMNDLDRWLEDFKLSELWRHNAIGANP